MQLDRLGRPEIGGFSKLSRGERLTPVQGLANFLLRKEGVAAEAAGEDGAGDGHFGEGGQRVIGAAGATAHTFPTQLILVAAARHYVIDNLEPCS